MVYEQKRCEEINGVMYHRCFSDFNSDFISEIDNMCNFFSNCFSEVKKNYGEFDVVHGHDWVTVNALSQIKAKSKAKIIFMMHSTELGRCGNNLYEGTPRVIRDLEWCGGHISDNIILVSQHLKDEVECLYNILWIGRYLLYLMAHWRGVLKKFPKMLKMPKNGRGCKNN